MAKFLGGSSSSGGKYFELRSKLNNLRLTVSGGLMAPGTPVVTWHDHPGDNQVWYEDPLTATVRSLQTHMCLQFNDKHIVVDLYDAKDPNQRWRVNREKSVIENMPDPQKVIEVEGANKDHGTKLTVGQYADKNYQKFSLEFKPINYFYLSNEMNGAELYLEAETSKPKVGTRILLRPQQTKKSFDQQLWYEDYQGNLRCKAAEKLVLDGNKGNLVFGEPATNLTRNFWVYIGNRIVNRDNYNEVAEVKGRIAANENKNSNQLELDAKNSDQLELGIGIYLGDTAQHFKQEYVKT